MVSSDSAASPGAELPSDFPTAELIHALEEQSFGISSYELRSFDAHEATAQVVFLEGHVVTVSLSTTGYKATEHRHGNDGDPCSTDRSFESIEELMEHISPRYVEKRREAIMARLQALSEQDDR
ncbi:uncharacterized protein LAESUDRAFT_712440 [Laetiporus sulphureus 93-53]|uniref:GSKIP domain-containing protein n=1 Tax=Laetiporus sulphureus 93-53 TaxID=1314785 RepID=A0A165FSL0_9APHY|nr:uncharacterized protein LAESUDRAFT_712440 [Laetiporus sulphureus 93-53]KZT09359.1 hypothetical protein LAESUDRAFT_712440 [Laetiporus sulphureus 93-53]